MCGAVAGADPWTEKREVRMGESGKVQSSCSSRLQMMASTACCSGRETERRARGGTCVVAAEISWGGYCGGLVQRLMWMLGRVDAKRKEPVESKGAGFCCSLWEQ